MTQFLERPFGTEARHAITAMRNTEGELQVGNVLRRTCEYAGEGACKQVCQLRSSFEAAKENPEEQEIVDQAQQNRECADLNLQHAIGELGLKPKNVLMVGVTKNEIGFADKIDEYEIKDNPYGWYELPGFNAFFTRTEEFSALGRRLADCADLNFEFKDGEGKTVIGFEHGTRTGMFGIDQSPYEIDGEKVSFTELAIAQAIEHYGADPATINIKLAAVIKGHNFKKHFDSREKMEDHVPGWYADGFLTNVTNPEWQEDDPVVESDTWYADSRGMIIRDINRALKRFGIPEENFNMEGAIDPADTNGEHSSHEFRETFGDTRDGYFTFVPDVQE